MNTDEVFWGNIKNKDTYICNWKKTDKISRTSNKEKGQKECNIEDIENQKSKDKQHVAYLACLSEWMARQVKR